MADASSIPPGIHVRLLDDIAIMWLNNGENRLNMNSVREMNAALDKVERNESIKALIISGVGKYFSCGLDLDWLSKQDDATLRAFFPHYEGFITRLLVFPMPTVAAINGHAYAAGGFMAMACDYRIMRTQRGWICFPEININLPLRAPITELLRTKLPNNVVFRDMALYGQRLTAEEAKERDVIDECVDMKDLMDTALAFIRNRLGAEGFGRVIVGQMKQNLYGKILEYSKTYNIDNSNQGPGLQRKLEEAHKARL